MPRAKSIVYPEWDTENLCPKTKMPNCPYCEEDELGMLTAGHVFCYACGFENDPYFLLRPDVHV